MRRRPLLCTSLLLLLLPVLAHVRIRLVAKTTIPANATDLSRLPEGVGSDCNLFGGISGIAYTGKDNLYVLLPDRGPKDGNTEYLCRFHTMKINVVGDQLTTVLQSTTLLRDEMDRPFVGLQEILTPTAKYAGRLDPKGFASARAARSMSPTNTARSWTNSIGGANASNASRCRPDFS